MSNLRSDALDYIKRENFPPGHETKVFIEHLCAQIDQVEELWHDEAKKRKAGQERAERVANELFQIDAFVHEVTHPNRDRVRKALVRLAADLRREPEVTR